MVIVPLFLSLSKGWYIVPFDKLWVYSRLTMSGFYPLVARLVRVKILLKIAGFVSKDVNIAEIWEE